jgi:glycosyltransferase involved in cell wall biosynthesis
VKAEAAAAARPRISIILSFRDAGAGLDLALESLLWQTEEDWELIAIDDGSRDGSADQPSLHGDPRIRLVRHGHSAGLAVRLNEAVGLARGQYIARMDADDISFPQRLRVQADYLDVHRDVDLLASSVLMIDDAGRAIGLARSPAAHAQLVRRAALHFPMPHPTWMGRAEWFRAHPYDARALKAQDQHLLYRSFRDSRFAAIEQPLLAYRYAKLSARKTLLGRYHFLRAVWAHGNVLDACMSSALHAAAALRDLIAMALGRDRAVILGRVGAIPDTLRDEWANLSARLDAARD